MAAYAALVSLMNNIEKMMSHPRLSTCFNNNHIQPLVEKAGFLLDFIEGSYNHDGGSKEVAEGLEKRITFAAHAAEDVIESHIVDQIHAGTSEVSLRSSLDLQQIIRDIDTIMTEAIEEKQGWGTEKSTYTAEPLMESVETRMVGLDDELTWLLDLLTGYQSNRHIISIVGMGGTGKTTLAKHIYEHGLVKEHFDTRAWATISQQYNADEIILRLISCIGKPSDGTLGEALHKSLYGRRYLIVLDDIWSVEAWDKVCCFLPDNRNRSRLVLTTRLSNIVANDFDSSCLKMDLLNVDKSWKLFCDKASFPHNDDPLGLEGVGREIVASCKGLALSIVVIGGLLVKSPRTVGYWKSVARDMKSIRDSKEKQESLDVLCLSYNHLPPHLKPCFLYMGVFGVDSEIRVSNLIKLWIGEGFLKPSESIELEEVGEGYIKDLIDRNLILATRQSSNGKIRICGIHHLLRDLSLIIAEEQKFYVDTYHGLQGTERRLVKYWSETNQKKIPLARSIISSSCLPMRSRLLRVLNHDRGRSVGDYCENVNLRYLAFNQPCRDNFLLPSSVSLVWNLQTLIIHQFFRSQAVVAPAEFWKMRQLRHVQCERMYIPNPPEDEVLMLEKLQTLKTVVNLALYEEVCSIIPNIKKLHLRYDGCLERYDESRLCNLNSFHKLESLDLICDAHELSKVVRLPNSLKKLSLEGCCLCWEDMKMIGLLPQLEVLKLNYNSVTEGEVWSNANDQFLSLKVLEISDCRLVVWDADSSHFPVLEKLHLLGLNELKEIPLGIGEIPTLEYIRVEFCSESSVISAIKIKEDRVDTEDSDDLQIQVKVGRSDLKSFEERLKTEELTINNIGLKVGAFINFLWENSMLALSHRPCTLIFTICHDEYIVKMSVEG